MIRAIADHLRAVLGIGPHVEHIRRARRRTKTTRGARGGMVRTNGTHMVPGLFVQGLTPEECRTLEDLIASHRRIRYAIEQLARRQADMLRRTEGS